ncbi:MAG: phosphatidylglycerol lysyltransferase domain-containing protein [Syntrophothermus sp.]
MENKLFRVGNFSFIPKLTRPFMENSRLIARFFLTIVFIGLGAWFFKHEQHEIREIREITGAADWRFISLGIGTVVLYILAQGMMYKMAFASVGSKVQLLSSVLLFLKRNFISVFIPAGGVTSMAFFSGTVESGEISKTRIYLASSIYVFIGIATVGVISVPIFIYAVSRGLTGKPELISMIILLLFLPAVFFCFRSVMRKGIIYRYLEKFIPKVAILIQDLREHAVSPSGLLLTFTISLLIDSICILQLYLAMRALNIHPSITFAMIGYLISVLTLFVSPFMRGLGAVEVSMAFILIRLGYPESGSVAITFTYRFFEFWLPLLAGILSFLVKINRLLLRIVPALLIFLLGIINIISSITPAIAHRMHLLRDFIPLSAISASNYLVLISGAFLLLTAVFMFKGLRNAWWIGLILSIVSCIGHLTKAIDYEEATVALIVILMLIISRKQYVIRGNPRLHVTGIWTGVLSIVAVLIYGTIGFYFLDKKHFNIDFSLSQSIMATLKNFFLLNSPDLVPDSRFARDFLISINLSGILSLSFLFFTIIRYYSFREETAPGDLEKARKMITKFGNSGMDYFKTYFDKMIFFPDGADTFISYKVAGNYAVVLEGPVAPDPEMKKKSVSLFDQYCYEQGLKSIFYRVPETDLPCYSSLRKRQLFMGQQAYVDLENFKLEGGKYKSLRNAMNKLTDRGYKATVHLPPLKDGLLQKLQAVSGDWLKTTRRTELVFSQGIFIWEEIKQQTVITVENAEELVIAFLNIIPDFAPGEGTYDLIRKTKEAPHGVLEFLLIELFKHLRSQNLKRADIGFVPLSGIKTPSTVGERSLKFAYEKLRPFSHYKRMRYFREKFFPEWENRYLVYSNEYDLLQIPSVLAKVIKA